MAASFSLAGTLRLVPSWVDTLTATTVTDTTTILQSVLIADGTGAGQANFYWRDVRTIGPSNYDEIALTSLPLKAYGGQASINVQALRLIYVRNRSETVPIFYGLEGAAFEIAPGATFFWNAADSLSPPVNSWVSPPSAVLISKLGTVSADYEIVLVGVKA